MLRCACLTDPHLPFPCFPSLNLVVYRTRKTSWVQCLTMGTAPVRQALRRLVTWKTTAMATAHGSAGSIRDPRSTLSLSLRYSNVFCAVFKKILRTKDGKGEMKRGK